MHTISQYTSLIEEAISELRLPAGNLEGLYAPIAYGLQAGGKRLRPVLTLLAAEAFGGDIEAAMPLALAVEMFHNFTLLHDDVMDNSPTRRGRPSVMAKNGVNSAILSGDTMLTLATQLVMRAPDHCLRAALDCFNKTAIEVYEGQQLDIDFESRSDVSMPEYLEMIRLKTSVLLGCAAKMGALVGGADEAQASLIYKCAENIGLAFQIKDDLLDVYGAADFGKPIGGDILNEKKTFLLITALASPEYDNVMKALAIADCAEKISTVTAIYDRLNMKEVCETEINRYTDKALDALQQLRISEAAATELSSLCSMLARRSK